MHNEDVRDGGQEGYTGIYGEARTTKTLYLFTLGGPQWPSG